MPQRQRRFTQTAVEVRALVINYIPILRGFNYVSTSKIIMHYFLFQFSVFVTQVVTFYVWTSLMVQVSGRRNKCLF